MQCKAPLGERAGFKPALNRVMLLRYLKREERKKGQGDQSCRYPDDYFGRSRKLLPVEDWFLGSGGCFSWVFRRGAGRFSAGAVVRIENLFETFLESVGRIVGVLYRHANSPKPANRPVLPSRTEGWKERSRSHSALLVNRYLAANVLVVCC